MTSDTWRRFARSRITMPVGTPPPEGRALGDGAKPAPLSSKGVGKEREPLDFSKLTVKPGGGSFIKRDTQAKETDPYEVYIAPTATTSHHHQDEAQRPPPPPPLPPAACPCAPAPFAHNQGLTASGTINVGADRPLREQHAAEWLLPSSEASKDEPELRKRYVRDARRRRQRRRCVAYVERVPSPQPYHSHHRALRPSGDSWFVQWG